MKKYILISIFILSVLVFQSCTDCPVSEQDPVYLCETRIVTIEKFNPNYTIIPGTNGSPDSVVLDADYNIAIYQFPINSGSSGSFPNDNRFKDNKQIPIATVPFAENNVVYYANLMDTYPTNEDLNGDILVKDVDLLASEPNAMLRFAGSIALFDQNYLDEDAQAFCDYVKGNSASINSAFDNFTDDNKYGKNQNGAVVTNYDLNPVIVSDKNGKIIGTSGQPNVPLVGSGPESELRTLANKKSSVDLRVIPGNVYVYLAKNGKRFVFFITELRESNITPFRKRVTIMLYPLDK